MDIQKWDKLFRTLSVETAQIYRAFYEVVIRDNGKLADVAKSLNGRGIARSQSAITKIVNSLISAVRYEIGIDFIKKTNTGKWNSSKYAVIIYKLAIEIEGNARNYTRTLNEAMDTPHVQVAFSTFGMPFVKSIRQKAEALTGSKINLIYMNSRTKDLPSVLDREFSVDFCLGETLRSERDHHDHKINEGRKEENSFESRIVGTEKIVVMANYDIRNDVVDSRMAITLPVKTVNQGIMLRFLAELYGIGLDKSELGHDAVDYLRRKRVKLVEPLYDNVHTLIESFILDETPAVIFAGETVAEQIRHRRDFIDQQQNYANASTVNIRRLEFETENYLDKRLYRRVGDEKRFAGNHPYNAFWEVTKEMQERVLAGVDT